MAERTPHDLVELAEMAVPDIRLIATDMDGTLLDDDRQIHAHLWPLVEQLDERGITFCPASGRHHVSLRRNFAPIARDVTYIASNGAHVLDGDTERHSDCLDPALAASVLATMRDVDDARAILLGKDGAYVETGDELAFDWIEAFAPPVTLVDDLVDAVELLVERGDGVLSVGIFDGRSAEQNSLQALRHLRDKVNVMATHHTWVDVVSPTADKGTALATLQADLGIGAENTMVFGDFLNDLGMIDRATYSFAMANAHDEVKARARWTAPSNAENGVVRTICAVLGIEPV